MPPDPEPIESILHGAVAIANAYSVYVIARTSKYMAEDFRPHLWFVAGWSAVIAVCMVSLALGLTWSYTVEVLNFAALFVVGGWATLLCRVARRIQRAVETGAHQK